MKKEKVIGFIWQHFLLLLSMFFMTFGVALCVRSNLVEVYRLNILTYHLMFLISLHTP